VRRTFSSTSHGAEVNWLLLLRSKQRGVRFSLRLLNILLNSECAGTAACIKT
jgi:hypothetical protein